MFKKLCLIALSLCLAMSVGCGKSEETLSVEKPDSSVAEVSSVESEPELHTNPLTGLSDISEDKINDRPVAVTVNNIKVAQPVQTGLGKADIVYETEVEGGITRLLAVYQDISKVERIGTVRSARYAFIDLAMGHNAIFIHHGKDYFHALYHLEEADRLELSTSNGGVRVSNGLATEHTLYAYGEKLWNNIEKKGFKTENSTVKAWQTFADESEALSLESTANSVTVPFSSSVKSTFTYDTETKKYTRSFNGTIRKDYNTGEKMQFKNVFVLYTTIRNYNCTGNDYYQHREVLLNGGEGYYFVNGTYTKIKWTKGNDTDPVKFTNTDGTPLTVNAGNSWVCIADSSKSKAEIK